MIHRRHALGLIAAASLAPVASFANVSYQRSEFRDGLGKRFADLGTAGTFVGYKVDDYLIIASDKVRSGEDRLPASTFKVPNSLIALETEVVAVFGYVTKVACSHVNWHPGSSRNGFLG